MENSLTYTMNGDYQIPDLKLTEQPEKPLGKYGRMRKAYLKEHRPLIYNQLKASDPMKWVGLMNTCKAQAEEILMAELIHS